MIPNQPPNPRRRLRVGRLVALGTTLVLAGLATVGCSSGQAGSPSVTPSTAAASATADAGATTTSRSAVEGRVNGDVSSIRVFTDPASQIKDNADLAAYVLPGMSGSGVDCATTQLDPGTILAMNVNDGANSVAGIVADCFDTESVGAIVAMYAVGFEADGTTAFGNLALCAANAFGEKSDSEGRAVLESIFGARMDLMAPPTSAGIARDYLVANTHCFAGPTETSSAAPSVPVDTSPPGDPAAQTRTIKWYAMAQGFCLPEAIPAGEFTTITVGSCELPHVSEVVGATFKSSNPSPEDQCRNLFKHYTGQDLEATTWVMEVLEATSTMGSSRIICLATSPTGAPTTGSLKAP